MDFIPDKQHGSPFLLLCLREDHSITKSSLYNEKESSVKQVESSVIVSFLESINELRNEYIFRNDKEIIEFLFVNRQLFDILFLAHLYIRDIFGDVKLYLELYENPEENDKCLFIIIQSNYSTAKSFDLLDRLSDEWWIDVDREIKRLLEIDITTNK